MKYASYQSTPLFPLFATPHTLEVAVYLGIGPVSSILMQARSGRIFGTIFSSADLYTFGSPSWLHPIQSIEVSCRDALRNVAVGIASLEGFDHPHSADLRIVFCTP